MGKPAARDTDVCTGHGPFPPRVNVTSSGDVFVNGMGSLRETDGYEPHCVGPSCHPGAIAAGSGTVFINGLPAARISDPIDCGSFIAQGSSDVLIGG